ncbi:zinc ribbon domain-containing protein [Acidobacteria bacterium AH-259-D05]|nr:zinc ribbon domain-containing protein [Acidobacteria bacterium AH-259-D05]
MATKKCPFCAEEIQEEAIKCKHCGEELHTTRAQWAELASSYRKLAPSAQKSKWNQLTDEQRTYLKDHFGVEAPPPSVEVAPTSRPLSTNSSTNNSARRVVFAFVVSIIVISLGVGLYRTYEKLRKIRREQQVIAERKVNPNEVSDSLDPEVVVGGIGANTSEKRANNIPSFDEAAYNAAINDFKKLLNEDYGDSGGLTRIEIDGFRVALYWNDFNWWIAPKELRLEITKLVLLAWVGLLRDHKVTHQSTLPMTIIDETKIEIRSLINSEGVFAEADGRSGDVKVYEMPNRKEFLELLKK